VEYTLEDINQLSDQDIRAIREFYRFTFPNFEDSIDSDIWKVHDFNGTKMFFYFGVFFYVDKEGNYVAYKVPDEPEEPFGTMGWVLVDKQLQNVLTAVAIQRVKFMTEIFFQDEYDFEKGEFLPRTSRFECAMRNKVYKEYEYDPDDDDIDLDELSDFLGLGEDDEC
jgi:hypothetical protein